MSCPVFNFFETKHGIRPKGEFMADQSADGTILKRAVTQNHALSRAGFSERLFAWLFKGLVYPQIWEDPDVDMAALAIQPGHRIVTIASGGCNALSYLTADPARVEARGLVAAYLQWHLERGLRSLPYVESNEGSGHARDLPQASAEGA